MTAIFEEVSENGLTVFAESEEYLIAAKGLANSLSVPLSAPAPSGLFLRVGVDGLSLVEGNRVLRGDFCKMLPRLKKNNLQSELLIKAAKIKDIGRPLSAIDATAGFGEDSLLLAAAGFSVRLYEYNKVIAALLADALRRAADISELSEAVSRMELHSGDSITAMKSLDEPPDVILLDPMFPTRQKSALVKKKFQLLHYLESPCDDETALLDAAVAARPRKIVIKRPQGGAYLAGVKPSYSIVGKAIRYDCLVFPQNIEK